jgi:hypothetical protein
VLKCRRDQRGIGDYAVVASLILALIIPLARMMIEAGIPIYSGAFRLIRTSLIITGRGMIKAELDAALRGGRS